MHDGNWFDDEAVRYRSCLEAVCGHYGLADANVFAPGTIKARHVLLKMLVLCRVSTETFCAQTGVNRYEACNWFRVVTTAGTLSVSERNSVSLLMRHLAIGMEADSEFPSEASEYRHGDYDRHLRRLWEAHYKLLDLFRKTGKHRRWDKKFNWCGPLRAVRKFRIKKRRYQADHDERDAWVEDRANDALILRCMGTIAEPVDWHRMRLFTPAHSLRGEVVYLVQGYQLAFGLNDQETARFVADGRVVLVEGHSTGAGGVAPTRCLLFLTVDDARRFWSRYME